MLLGSQGEWSDSVWAGQCKCNPQLFKGKKKPDTELGAHCWQINSIVLVYTRPHIIQGGLAERGKLAPRATSCHACSAAAPDKCCCDSLSTDTVPGSSLIGTGAKSLVYRGARKQGTRIYLRERDFKALGPTSCVSTRGCQVWPPPLNWPLAPTPGDGTGHPGEKPSPLSSSSFSHGIMASRNILSFLTSSGTAVVRPATLFS